MLLTHRIGYSQRHLANVDVSYTIQQTQQQQQDTFGKGSLKKIKIFHCGGLLRMALSVIYSFLNMSLKHLPSPDITQKQIIFSLRSVDGWSPNLNGRFLLSYLLTLPLSYILYQQSLNIFYQGISRQNRTSIMIKSIGMIFLVRHCTSF